MFLQNVGICLQIYMKLQPRRPTLKYFPTCLIVFRYIAQASIIRYLIIMLSSTVKSRLFAVGSAYKMELKF
jgi:hypothetical protein